MIKQKKQREGEKVAWRNEDKRRMEAPAEEEAGDTTEHTEYELKKMTAREFEEFGKTYVFDKIMSKKDLTEEEKMKEAKKKLAEIVKK